MDPRDEARLNDWIEGAASREDAAAVEAMLAQDVALAAAVEAMRADRASLARLAAPTVPAELRAAVDDRVARMLLLAEPAGGPRRVPDLDAFPFAAEAPGTDTADWRARRHRRNVTRRWAVGAGSGLAAAAAITLLVVLQPGPPAGDDAAPLVADAGTTAPEAGAMADGRDRPTAPPFRPTEQAVVIHGLPVPTVAPPPVRMADAASDSRGTSGVAEAARAPDAPVPAIRFAGLDRAELEARLVALAGVEPSSGRPGVSVTRNLTTDALARMAPRTAERSREPLWADLERGRGDGATSAWRTRVDERVDRVVGARGGSAETAPEGRVIAGAATQRPGWGEQIVFAEAGATWTLSVPANAVAEVLARLESSLGDAARSGLVTLDPVQWRVGDGTAAWREAREELRRLAIEDPQRLVHIPIVLAGE